MQAIQSVTEKFSSMFRSSVPKTGSDTDEDPTQQQEIVREEVVLPKCFESKLAFVLHNVLTKKECEDLIKKTEKMGYEGALVNVGCGRQLPIPDVRNNTRCIWDSEEEADRIWQRIKSYVPEIWKGHKVLGLNERLRFLRYDAGEYFKPHMDGHYRRENGDRSFITIQAYLNEGFQGGGTTFMNFAMQEKCEVVPKTGSVLIFQHDIMHEGSELLKGRKYSVRTDVMYTASNSYKAEPEHSSDLRVENTNTSEDSSTSEPSKEPVTKPEAES